MKIEFSVDEYFKQLKLMEQQYGQEEDLYPWIYMLLQGVNYKNVSIRDVHNMKKTSLLSVDDDMKYWNIRWELTKRVGPPDFAIIKNDYSVEETEPILGCVEIKKKGLPLFLKGRKKLEKLPEKMSYNRPEVLECILGYYRASEFLEEDKKLLEQYKFTEHEKKACKKYEKQISDKEKEIKAILCGGSKNLIDKSDSWLYVVDNLPAGRESKQLAGHLDKFKKVIYTNGYDFYYLEGDEDCNVICLELARLCIEKKDRTYNRCQWKRLLVGLQAIDWSANSNIESIKSQQDVHCKECKIGSNEGEITWK